MLNLQIPINHLGYGVAGINIAEALLRKQIQLNTHSIGQPNIQLVSELLKKSLEQNLIDHKSHWPLIKIWHQNQLIDRIGNGPYYGFPIFELDTFSFDEKCHLVVPEHLLVCSNWAKNIVQDQIDRLSHVVPLGVDRSIFNENGTKNSNDIYKFFTIGKLEYRKGHDFIVNCFHKAFDINDKVELNMMVHNPFLQQDMIQNWISGFKAGKLGSKINFINPVQSHNDVANFIHSQDCGLFPSRAEGWNLELLESMSCGKPVITTNYSAHTEYCTKDNAYLIDITDTEPAHDHMGGMWFRGQGNWAELDLEQEDQMIEHMRNCYKNKPNNIFGIETSKQFTWDNSAEKILEVL